MTRLNGKIWLGLLDEAFRSESCSAWERVAFIVDVPPEGRDNARWKRRRELVAEWWKSLQGEGLGERAVDLYYYPAVMANNGDLGGLLFPHSGGKIPDSCLDLEGGEFELEFDALYCGYDIIIAVTEFSATAPLKMAAKVYGFRAATMPGFSEEMEEALSLDFGVIRERCDHLKGLLDEAVGAEIVFEVNGKEMELYLDLRYRSGHASSGCFPEAGMAGNLPSGESYIVPYEGEKGEESKSRGLMPIEREGEIFVCVIEGNKVVEVQGEGAEALKFREWLDVDKARRNIAELGLGVLGDMGIKACGEILLDEKLGLHIAFGRSEHLGGVVGPESFSDKSHVVHVDYVYVKDVQPHISSEVHLLMPDGKKQVVI